LRNLTACTWSLLSEIAKIIPCIFRIMVARRSDRGRGGGLSSPSLDGGLEEVRGVCLSRA